MKRFTQHYALLLVAMVVWSCGPKVEPSPAFPDYLSVPSALENYKGSGLVTIDGGGLSLKATGPERLDATTKTYQGVNGDINRENLTATFTLGQPLTYKERQSVPSDLRANGRLSIMQTVTPGTYRMGFSESPGPRGELSDLILNLPGPQLYVAKSGSLTISKSTLVKTQGDYSLYRIEGTFQVIMYADGIGIVSGKQYPELTGTFDLLLTRI